MNNAAVVMDAEIQSADALRVVMEDWAKWQASYRPKTGFPGRSIGIESGFIGMCSSGFDDLIEENDQRICKIVDTAVDDLGAVHPAQKSAIMHRYLAVSFRFPRDNYPQLLSDAHDWLTVALRRRGVVL